MTWHNQVVILKQQLQQLAIVIGSGLIQVIKPVVMQINSALSGLIKFAQNVVNALGKIFGWKMEVNTKGLTIDDDAFDVDYDDLEGASDATFIGHVTTLKIDLSGSSNIVRTLEENRYGLACDSCEGSMSGSSNAYIHSDGTIRVSLSGASDLHFTGNAFTGDCTTSGGSNIFHDVL